MPPESKNLRLDFLLERSRRRTISTLKKRVRCLDRRIIAVSNALLIHAVDPPLLKEMINEMEKDRREFLLKIKKLEEQSNEPKN